MGVISLTLPSDGDTIDAADVNTPFNTIQTLVNGNLDANNLADAAVTPKKLIAGLGTTWAWSSYTPTWASTTLGNGSVSGSFIQIGKTVFFRANFLLGTTSAVGTSPTVSLPVASVAYSSAATTQPIGSVYMMDNGVTAYWGVLAWASTTAAQPQAQTAGGTYAQNISLSAAVPFAFGSTDFINVSGTYEAA